MLLGVRGRRIVTPTLLKGAPRETVARCFYVHVMISNKIPNALLGCISFDVGNMTTAHSVQFPLSHKIMCPTTWAREAICYLMDRVQS